MRRLLAALSILAVVPACNGGASRSLRPESSSSTSSNPTAPSDDGAEPSEASEQPARGGVCAAYIACIAKKAPEMLDTVTDAYGKTGSCWAEMSSEACEDACAKGKARAKCDVCDPALGSCVGEACAPNKRCATGEVCSKGKCIEEVLKTCHEDMACPAPYECAAVGCGYGCLLTCAADADCPTNFSCDEGYGFCVP